MIHVLVVGQTPPPFGGQAVMIEKLVRARMPRVRISHVRMAFSRDMADMGGVRAGKIVHLASVVARIAAARARHDIDILYYPPSGGSRVAMYRDVAVLLPARPLFRKTIFHLHAGGIAELLPRLARAERALFHRAFGRPDCTIRVSSASPPDGALMGTRRDVVVPHGIEDLAARCTRRRPASAPPSILFAGVLRESKGVRVLLDACALLAREGRAFEVTFAGDWSGDQFRAEATRAVAEAGLEGRVHFPGVLTGETKLQAFADADVFCFPTFFEAETFGLVALEAMSFGLPVVATAWRGLPSLVRDGVSGCLVPTRDPLALAAKLRELLGDLPKARAMGRAGREIFLESYTLERHLENMEQVFVDVAAQA